MSELNDLLTAWNAAKTNADYWVGEEMRLRKLIAEQEFPEPKRGRNPKRIDHGMALVLTHKFNYSVDRAGVTAAMKADNMRPLIEEVISWSPKVSDAKFEGLDDESKNLFDGIITQKPASPALEIVPQSKIKKW